MTELKTTEYRDMWSRPRLQRACHGVERYPCLKHKRKAGHSAVAWQKGWSIRETAALGAGVIESKADGRTNLGGDIMIHGKAVTIGCVPVGDDVIEDIFYLASAVGIKNVSVVIAPYDIRKGRKPGLERSPLKWYPALCNEIHAALKEQKGI